MALLRRNSADRPRVLRKDRTGASPVAIGLILLLIVSAGTYLGFTKHIPFTHGYRLKAVFNSANSIRKNSPVRIAGVKVGKVKSISRESGTNASVVTMELTDNGLPIHKDATAKIRPRIFLEGNFFVDIKPGTPSSPTLSDGDTLPMTQTSDPVQLGDVLTALQSDTRQNLQSLIVDLGTALTVKPRAVDDANADPSVKGLTGAEALNRSTTYAPSAFRNSAIVNQAFLGTSPHDVSKLIGGLAKVSKALDTNESTLQDFVTNFNTTMQALGDESTNLRSSIRELGPTLSITNQTLGHLDSSLPNTRAFAREILPGVRETPATISASFPWIAQVRKLVSPAELQGLARELSPATRDLSKTVDATTQLLPQQDLLAKCLDRVILPTGDIKIQDSPATTNEENYKEFWYTMVGLAGEGQNFDGNGMYVRFQPGGGLQTVSTGAGSLSGQTLFGRNDNAPTGTRPAFPGKRPPYRPDVPCYTNKLPDLNGAATGRPDGSAPAQPNAPGGGGAGGAGGITIPVPGTGGLTIPPLNPTLPALPGGRSAPRAPAKDDVTAQLLDRLNPFRSGGGR